MTTYLIEFGPVGDARPVPPLTLAEDDRDAFCRAVARHAIPYLTPVLAEMGHPEYADCLFRTNKSRTLGEFMWLSLAAGVGASFCRARISVVPGEVAA